MKKKNGEKSIGIRNINQERIVPVLLAGALFFLLFLYAPLELLFANEYEFSYNMYDLLKLMLPVMIISTALLSAVLLLVRSASLKAYEVLMAVLLAALVSFYVQGTFFAGHLPPLDGRKIVWAEYDGQRLESIILWVLAFLTAGVSLRKLGGKRFEKGAMLISLFFILILGGSLLITCFATGGYRRNKNIVHSSAGLMDLSKDRNLVIFLIDAVDGEAFQEVLACHPEAQEAFEDFTSYTNAMSAYPYTSRSIPFILSGLWYENEEPYGTYCGKAFTDSPLFKSLKEQGYRMGLYDPEFSFITELDGMFENISGASHFVWPLRFVKMQIMMAGYRYFPYDLKKFCYLTPEEIYSDTVKTNGLEPYYEVDNAAFLKDLEERPVTLSVEKCFRFIYIRGAHEPFAYEAQAEAIKDNSYKSSVEFCVSIAEEYLKKLKEAGVYDETAIVFLADHGYVENDVAFGRQNPFLMIKGVGERHPFAVSDAPVSHEDLQEAFRRLLAGAPAENAFEWSGGDKRERRFLFFNYEAEETMWEYLQTGHASDEDTMTETGRVYVYKGA